MYMSTLLMHSFFGSPRNTSRWQYYMQACTWQASPETTLNSTDTQIFLSTLIQSLANSMPKAHMYFSRKKNIKKDYNSEKNKKKIENKNGMWHYCWLPCIMAMNSNYTTNILKIHHFIIISPFWLKLHKTFSFVLFGFFVFHLHVS